MRDNERFQCQKQVEELVDDLIEHEMLSDYVCEEIDSLLDDDRYTEAGILAVGETSQTQVLDP